MAGTNQLQGIQALRGLAALAVVTHHALEHSNGAARPFSPDWLTTVGAAGVDLFFVISGFIMVWTTFPEGRAPLRPATFLYRRVVRIYPLYWLTCTAMLALVAMGFLRAHNFTGSEIARSFALFPPATLVGVAWTLVFEMWFYILFTLLLASGSRRVVVIGVPGLLLCAAALATFLPAGPVRDFLQSPLPIEFCYGIGLAIVGRRVIERPLPRVLALALGALALIAMCLAAVLVPHATTAELPAAARVLAWGLPALVLVGLSLPLRARGRAGAALARLGDTSYALYLSHVFVMIGYGRLLKIPAVAALPQPPLVLAICVGSVAGGFAFHIACERPLTRLFRSFETRRPANPSVA
ncbi:acyltransferase family protein [Novosphingobium percolationis]|uniref:acyltransferase family protein n=1 Tax=Novosphingobium percolationis TaxID=2871811 RepID=UPI001CD37159|nr:acyltransferase [Novosphingobium percolationis]